MSIILQKKIEIALVVLFVVTIFLLYRNQLLLNRIDQIGQSVVNVCDFGAKGDGCTDDVESIQNAIDYANTVGGVVFFPRGVYYLQTPLFYADNIKLSHALACYEGQTLVGNGAVLMAGSNDVTHILFTSNDLDAKGYQGCRNVKIEGIIFDCNESLTNQITSLNISHAQNVIIRDCYFRHGRGWHSIEINSSQNVIVDTCYFEDNSNSEDIQIDAAIGEGNLGVSDQTVCNDIEIRGCRFNTNNIAIGNHSDAPHHDISIHDNVFSGNGYEYIRFMSQVSEVYIYNNILGGVIEK